MWKKYKAELSSEPLTCVTERGKEYAVTIPEEIDDVLVDVGDITISVFSAVYENSPVDPI